MQRHPVPATMAGPLFSLLEKRAGSAGGAHEALEEVASRLGIPRAATTDEQLAGLALCAKGVSVDAVSRHLGWRDFERFCAGIMRAKGFAVRENVVLRRPRAQVDVLATSGEVSVAVDCKHWRRTPGRSGLTALVEAQKRRARRLHETLDRLPPIASAILVLFDGGARFVSGGAVVPVYAVGDFLDNIESYREQLDFI